jgi:hypothetical protein
MLSTAIVKLRLRRRVRAMQPRCKSGTAYAGTQPIFSNAALAHLVLGVSLLDLAEGGDEITENEMKCIPEY